MFIKEIYVSAYKTLIDFKFLNVHKDLNVFVGENNVGKSNILKALNMFFNRQGGLEDNEVPNSLFYIIQNKHDFYMDITFEDANNICDKLFNYRSSTITFRLNLDGEKKIQWVSGIQGKILDKLDNFQNIFNSLPKFIYIGDLNDKIFDLSTLQKLFSVEDIKDKGKIETIASQFLFYIFDRNINITLEVLPNEKAYQVNVIDNYGNSNRFTDKSSGLQQLSYLALFFAFNIVSENPNVILGLEEPEANLHSSLQRSLFKHIKLMAKELSIQTFLTTHSPVFLDKINHDSVFRVNRNRLFHTVITEGNYRDNLLKIRQDLGLSINDSLFLGGLNLVVEGVTEKIIFPKIISLLNDINTIKFGIEDINILNSQGANNTYYFCKLISQLGLPTCVILDKDQEGLNVKRKIEGDLELANVKVLVLERESFEECEIEDLIDDKILVESLNSTLDIDLTLEGFKELRTNQHNNSFKKFSNTIKDLGEKERLSKFKLAEVIHKKINEETIIALLVPYFIQIDRFYSSF